jgi:hypothetical protein
MWLFAATWCMACALPCRGGESDDYLQHVRPVLAERCYACHGAWKQEGALRLDTVASMQRGGDGGSVLDTQTPALELTRLNQAGTGRDHHPHGFTISMAGGGIKPGYVHGATDELGFHAVEHPHYVTDIHANTLHLLGVDPRSMNWPGRKRLDVDYGNVIHDIIV